MTKEHKSGDSELGCQTLMTDCLTFISISGEALPLISAAAAEMTSFGRFVPYVSSIAGATSQAMGFAKKSWAIDSSPNLKWFANLEENMRYQISHYGNNACSIYTGCDLKSYCQKTKNDSDVKTFFCGVQEKAARQKDVTNVSDIVFNV